MGSNYEKLKAQYKIFTAQEKSLTQMVPPSLQTITDRTEKRFNKLLRYYKVSSPTELPERELYVFFGDALKPSTLFSRKSQRVEDALKTFVGKIYNKELRKWEEYSAAQGQIDKNFETLLRIAEPIYAKFGYSYDRKSDTFSYTRGATLPDGYKQRLVKADVWAPELLKLTEPVNFKMPNLFKKRPDLLVGGTRKRSPKKKNRTYK